MRKNNKRNLAHVCLRSMQERSWRWRLVTMGHYANESTTIFYLNDAAKSGKSLIRVFSEETGLFVLLVCWLSREMMECKVHMERWNITMLPQCAVAWHVRSKQLRHDLIYIHQSQDQSAKHLGHWRILRILHWWEMARHRRIRWQKPFFITLHGQPPGTSMASARFTVFINK